MSASKIEGGTHREHGDEPPRQYGSVDEVFAYLNAIHDRKTLEGAFRTGAAVVSYLYGADIEGMPLRGRRGRKYAELAAHPSLPIGKGELYRAIRVFELAHRYPEVLGGGELTLSHFLSVLSLRPDEQIRLLRLARDKRWTVRQLRHTVGATVAQSDAVPSGTGRPRVAPVIKTLRGLLASDGAFDGIEALRAVDDAMAQSLLEICRRAQTALDEVETTLLGAREVGRQARLMIVDGDPAFTTRAQRELRKYARSVRIAHSSAQAIARIDKNIACVAVSLHLPDGCGLALSEVLRREYPGLRCVYTTRVPRSELPERLRDASPLVTHTSGLCSLATIMLDTLHTRSEPAREASILPRAGGVP